MLPSPLLFGFKNTSTLSLLTLPSRQCWDFLQAFVSVNIFRYFWKLWRRQGILTPSSLGFPSSRPKYLSFLAAAAVYTVSYFWNGLFICWSWRQASEVNSERCLQKKQNVSEVCEAIHRINKQVSQQGGPRARWETRGTSIRMGSASASTWPGLRCESEFWGPTLGQGPPIARGWLTSKADFSGNGVVAIRAVLPNFGKKNSQAEGCGCVYSLPLFQPVINRIIGNHWKTDLCTFSIDCFYSSSLRFMATLRGRYEGFPSTP